MNGTFPGGRRFAFTIMDDTDVGTVANVGPVYRLLDELGMRTTKTVWSFDHDGAVSDFLDTDTLDDPAYVEFVHWLASRGFEIAFHGASMESSPRERTIRALARFRDTFGFAPRCYANHAYNRENLYWGADRIDDAVVRAVYRRFGEQPDGYYLGHQEGSPFYWGDVAREIPYVRNLTCAGINTLRFNPSMPYHDATRASVHRWFSASDAESVVEFNTLLAPAAQERLEREAGVCIVATHLGKGFASDGRVHPLTESLLRQLAARNGWFVPVSELLDHLAARRGGTHHLPSAEWRAMQYRWAWDMLVRNVQRRFSR